MPPEPGPLQPRPAAAVDAAAIAALHARSWRATYRGAYSDAYLDGPIDAERARFWRARLERPRPDLVTLVLDGEGDALAGFVCACLGAHPRWGTLVDNLHVAPGQGGRGLGRRLMHALAADLLGRGVAGPVHLTVLAGNAAARGFYERIGGCAVERLTQGGADGAPHPVDRMAWDSVAALSAGTA